MNQKKQFHRHFATPGVNLYWIIIAYIIIGWFFPVVGLVAFICMVGPVMTSIWKGRWWCGHVCPRISSWVAPKKAPLPKPYTAVHVAAACQMKCKSCARVCPMQLTPYDSRGQESGYLHPDCLKCGKCTLACPTKIMTL